MCHRILIADDSREIADSLVRLFTVLGHQAKAVYDGPAALQAAVDFEPEIAFIDIGMPAMDGYEVGRKLRELRGNQTILVAHTGWSRGQDKQHAYDCGFDLHVAKPVGVQTLEAILAILTPAYGLTRAMRIQELVRKLDAQ